MELKPIAGGRKVSLALQLFEDSVAWLIIFLISQPVSEKGQLVVFSGHLMSRNGVLYLLLYYHTRIKKVCFHSVR